MSVGQGTALMLMACTARCSGDGKNTWAPRKEMWDRWRSMSGMCRWKSHTKAESELLGRGCITAAGAFSASWSWPCVARSWHSMLRLLLLRLLAFSLASSSSADLSCQDLQ